MPGIGQTVAPVLWFLFSAWMLAIQYCDYPFDNHKVSFADMRRALRQHKTDNLQFGALVSLFTMIPILNLVILPVAVCGATAMGRSLPLAIRPITAAFTADGAGIFDRARISRPYHCA